MALDNVINFGKVGVSTGYDAAATSIVLDGGDGAKFPDPSGDNYNVVWWNSTDYPDPADDPNVEIVRVTAKSTDTLTVTRNQEGSGASTKNEGGKSYKMILGITAKMITDIETEIAEGGGFRGFTWGNPYDITSGFQIIQKKDLSTTNYTVPTGKVFLIESVTTGTTETISIDGTPVALKFEGSGGGDGGGAGLTHPIIADAGAVISSTADAGCLSGVLCTENTSITPIVSPISTTVSYTVPTGKILVVNNIYQAYLTTSKTIITSGGTDYDIWRGASLWDNTAWGSYCFVAAGDLVKSSAVSGSTILGYLIPDDFSF